MANKKSWKKLRSLPIWERLLIGVSISFLIGLVLWLICAPIIWFALNFVIHPFSSDRPEMKYWDGVLFSTFGLITFLITEISMVFLTIKSAWWDNMTIDKATKDHAKDRHKEGIRSNKAFNKLGYTGILGKPHHNPGIVVASKQNKKNIEDEEMYIAVEEEYHTVIAGPSGAGKTQIYNYNTIIHNLSTLDKFDKNGNIKQRIAPFIVVIDVKGELFRDTSKYASAKGYKVHTLNTTKSGKSLSFNPLFVPHKTWLKSKDENRSKFDKKMELISAKISIGNLAQSVTEFFEDVKGDAFWKNGEVALFSGMSYLLFDMYEAGVIDEHSVSLNTMFTLLTDIHKLINVSTTYGKSGPYKLWLKPTVDALAADPNNKAKEGLIMGLVNKLMVYNIYEHITSRDEWHKINHKEKNIVYIQVPDYEGISYKIATAFIEQLYHHQSEMASMHKSGKAMRKIVIVFDELANFPQIAALPKMTRMARGRGFQIMLSIQDYDAVGSVYGKEEARSMIEQCQVKIALKLSGQNAKTFSELVGEREKKGNKSLHTEREGVNVSISEDTKLIIRYDEISQFKILSDGNKEKVSESLIISPRSKPATIVSNRPFWVVKDHLVDAYPDFEFDIIETYYNKGTEVWDTIWKQKIKEADEKKAAWDSASWKRNFIKEWNNKHRGMPHDDHTDALLKEDLRKARKEFLEKNGMIPFANEVKKEVEEYVEKLGSFDYVEVASGSVVEENRNLSEQEILGYAETIKDFIRDAEKILKDKYPDLWNKGNYNDKIRRSIKDQWESKRKSKLAVVNAYYLAEELHRLLIEDITEHKDKIKNQKEWEPKLKEIKNVFNIDTNGDEKIFYRIQEYLKSSRVQFKLSKTADASATTSLYVVLGGGKKIRVSDHRSKTSGIDCHVEIIYNDETKIKDFVATWQKENSSFLSEEDKQKRRTIEI